jgi:NADH-ubiquinone oxidoreductase chain 5
MSYLCKKAYIFLNKKWHFDQVFNELIIVKIMNFGYFSTFQTLDKGLIEYIGPSGFTSSISFSVNNFSNMNSGVIHQSVFVFVSAISVFITFFLLKFLGLFGFFNYCFPLLIVGYILFFFSDC